MGYNIKVKDLFEFTDIVNDGISNYAIKGYGKIVKVELLAPGTIKAVTFLQVYDVQNYLSGKSSAFVERTFGGKSVPPEIEFWALAFK